MLLPIFQVLSLVNANGHLLWTNYGFLHDVVGDCLRLLKTNYFHISHTLVGSSSCGMICFIYIC